ncbi:MAG: T9SS type A sorting domain-containing protein [Bacteroidota bacterium]
MKRLLLLPIVYCFCLNATSQSFSGPESVEFDAANNRYLVSNRGAVKSIQSVIPGQTPTLFTSNVTGPAGLEILGNKLWVCDGGKIKSFDLTTGLLVNDINVGATFLNGVTSDGSQFLFVSDFSAKKIYRINTVTEAFNVMVANTVSSPNGMWYDGANNRLLFVNWGGSAAIKAVSLADSTLSTVTSTTLGNCDGIGRDAAGNYFVSAWSQQSIYKFDNAFGSPQAVVTSLSNPADIYYNTLNDTLAVPNSQNNTVTFHFMGSSVGTSTIEPTLIQHIYPNPIQTDQVLTIQLTNSGHVSLKIYSLEGRLLSHPLNEFKEKGDIFIDLMKLNLTRAQYIYVLEKEGAVIEGKLIVN